MEITNGGGDNKDPYFLDRLRKDVDANLSNDQYGVEELARNIGMSRSQLHRKLSSTTGQSVSQFIREHRLQRGMELLKSGEMTATEVADRIGFGSATYFNKCFNEYYGFPPGEAKNKHNEQQVSTPAAKHIKETVTSENTSKGTLYLWTSLVGVAVLIIAAFYLLRSLSSAPEPENKSIAILPFKNLSADQRSEYFSEGVIEAIRTNLSQIGELRVISRTSVERYRGGTKPAREIANELGVGNLLEGSVQRDSNLVRIEVRLVDGNTEEQIWSKRYDRTLQDVFAIQSEIAEQVAAELNATLSPEEKTKLQQTDTKNSEAYDLYLKGLYEYRTYTNRGVHNSIDLLEKAIALDSSYARAYAALANSYIGLATIFAAEMNALEALEKGKPFIDKALALAPNLCEAQMTLGFYLLYHDWDFLGAEAAYKQSIRTDYPDALALYVDYLNFVSRHEEALEMAERLNTTDPYYPNTRMILSYIYNQRLDQAVQFSTSRLKLFNSYYTFDSHGFLMLNTKNYDEAIRYFNKAIAIEGIRYPRMLGWMGAAYAKSGNNNKSKEIIEELKARWSNKENGSIAFFIAAIYSAMDDKTQALSWLKVAFDTHEMEMPWLLTEPQFYNLHNDPAFKQMALAMGFPQVIEAQ
jgi:TolB-like protein/AraC-like DNA-binding protein